MASETQMLILTLPQVIDAALTGPELGIVSFRLLNNILQVMCQQLNLEGVKVQYTGMQALQIQKIWSPEIKSKLPQVQAVKRTKLISADENEEEQIVVIPDGPSERFPAMTLAISNTQLQTMERNIRGLQKEVSDLKGLPTNNDLFRAVKTKSTDISPIVDMYQMLSVTKRMDATEQAVLKIASFCEDLARYVQNEDSAGLNEDFDSTTARRDSSHFDKMQSKGKVFSGGLDKSREFGISDLVGSESLNFESDKLRRTASAGKHPKTLDIGGLGRRTSASEKPDHPIVMIKENIGEEGFTEKRIKERAVVKEPKRGSPFSSSSKISAGSMKMPESKLKSANLRNLPSSDALALVQEELKNLRSMVENLSKMTQVMSLPGTASASLNVPIPAGPSTLGPIPALPLGPIPIGPTIPPFQTPVQSKTPSVIPEDRIFQIETKINQCIGQINKMDSVFSSSYTGITNRMAEIESSLKILSNKALQDVARADVEEQLTQNMFTLNEKETNMESVVQKLSEAVAALIEENNAKHNKFMIVVEDVSTLKSDKIGREEFNEALAEKVDICMINRKVSHDQFNATCDDLSRGIEEALEKLMEQEDLWHIALKEIQEEISEKLSKDDLTPLREFVGDKLKGLQQKVRTLTKMKQAQEAAATKSKFLTGVQCISCDQDVKMRKKLDESLDFPGAPMLPPAKNMAPYLAYELDQLRKQQRQNQFGKNLNYYESATRDNRGLINRYCGGSHTITTPQQRVTRIGNFNEQWGPKSLQVEKETLHCPSDRSAKEEIVKRSVESMSMSISLSKDSASVNKSKDIIPAEKDQGVQESKKSVSGSSNK